MDGVISNIVSEISNLKDALKKVKIADFIDKFNSSQESIKSKARESICQFPLLISDGMSTKQVRTLSKTLEMLYANFLQIAISQEDTIQFENEKSKKDFINRFHSNINKKISTDPMKRAEDVISINNASISEASKELLVGYMEDIETKSLNDMTIDSFNLIGINEDKDNNDGRGKYRTKGNKISADVKKLNDLQPTILELKVNIIPEKGEPFESTIKLGVKAVVHYIPSEEIIHYLPRLIKESNFAMRLIQWTTGEIKFFKDFILTLESIKDKVSRKRESGKWWGKLQSMASRNKIRGLINKKGILPTTTLILTMDDIEKIKNKEGVDLMRPKEALKLTKEILLMQLIAVDTIDEVCYFFDEEIEDWELNSFKMLEKNNQKNDDLIKGIISIASRK